MKQAKAVRLGEAQGLLWFELAPEVEAAVEEWSRHGHLTRCEVLKEGRVYRCGPAALKLGARRGFLARDAALREARLAHAIRPVRAPEPWAAFRSSHGSLLVSEFVEGLTLRFAWEQSPAARVALPELLAGMHANGVLHGDPHGKNILWNGEHWLLLDLGGLRRGLHHLLRRQLIVRHWARLVHDVTHFHPEALGELRQLFGVYLERVAPRQDLGSDPDRAWEVVLRGVEGYVAKAAGR